MAVNYAEKMCIRDRTGRGINYAVWWTEPAWFLQRKRQSYHSRHTLERKVCVSVSARTGIQAGRDWKKTGIFPYRWKSIVLFQGKCERTLFQITLWCLCAGTQLFSRNAEASVGWDRSCLLYTSVAVIKNYLTVMGYDLEKDFHWWKGAVISTDVVYDFHR